MVAMVAVVLLSLRVKGQNVAEVEAAQQYLKDKWTSIPTSNKGKGVAYYSAAFGCIRMFLGAGIPTSARPGYGVTNWTFPTCSRANPPSTSIQSKRKGLLHPTSVFFTAEQLHESRGKD